MFLFSKKNHSRNSNSINFEPEITYSFIVSRGAILVSGLENCSHRNRVDLISFNEDRTCALWWQWPFKKNAVHRLDVNRPFPSSLEPRFQSEAKSESFLMVISSVFHMNENSFSFQRLRTQTRFEIEARANSEMAYCHYLQRSYPSEYKRYHHHEFNIISIEDSSFFCRKSPYLITLSYLYSVPGSCLRIIFSLPTLPICYVLIILLLFI